MPNLVIAPLLVEGENDLAPYSRPQPRFCAHATKAAASIGGIMHSTGRPICALLLCVLVSFAPLSGAQQAAPQPSAPQPIATTSPSSKFVLDDGTPIKLRLDRNLSSADAKTGDNIDFEVLEEVKVNDVIVIPKGNIAIGTVTDAEHKRRMARGGKLDIEIDYVKLADGEKAAIRAVKETKGGGHTGAMTGAIVATSLVVWPAAPFFLFMHGKDTTIPKGTEITAYVNGNMPLDPAKFVPVASNVAASTAVTSQSTPTNAQLEITSNPAGAEISVDGNFVGDTPSELAVAAGVHTITISKHGYKPWERKLTVSSGKVTVAADLEQ
ncbi:MAG: PEGA domain-containing protein [Candidatus Korobacteraceae bacterium]